MRLSAVLLPSLLCAASASAQYFSAGWTPGQAAPNEPAAPEPAYNFDPAPTQQQQQQQPQYTPPAEAAAPPPAGYNSQLGIVDKILVSGPVSSLFSKLGLNMTDVIARGTALGWDPRIPLITDDNYNDVIVNEPMTEEEEKDRVWFLIVTVTASQNSAVSKIVDQNFDAAFNETLVAGDLPHVRWGRVDYMSVTYLTTKWAIWTGPYLVVITNRGQSLRFYKADRVRVSVDVIRELLTEEIWRNTDPWQSNFAPGGKREFLLHYFALALTKVFLVLNRVPRFVLMLASGAVASVVMRLLHKAPPEGPAPVGQAQPEALAKAETKSIASSATAVSTATSSPSKSKGKRKGGKK